MPSVMQLLKSVYTMYFILSIFHSLRPLSLTVESSAVHYNISPYAYVFGNPVNFIDPIGLDSSKPQVLAPATVNGRKNSFPLLGPLIFTSGLPLIYKKLIPAFVFPRNFIPTGASKFTSASSILFRRLLPGFKIWGRQVPKWITSVLPKATSLGGQLGRATSVIGAYTTIAQLVWDSYKNFKTLPVNQQSNFVNSQMTSGTGAFSQSLFDQLGKQ